ncbi:DUF4127 family protein [Bacillus sp. JJ1521]|uniref:DUF4127 family protein n=1 Tax=Bacillus sp. JJ1521 TaxID=3122957 RepID=UPI003000C26D
MKIVYLPLDERPCNLVYPQQLADAADVPLYVPSISWIEITKGYGRNRGWSSQVSLYKGVEKN